MVRLTFIFLLISQTCFGQIKSGVYTTKEDTVVLRGKWSKQTVNDPAKYIVGDTVQKEDSIEIQEISFTNTSSIVINGDGTFEYIFRNTVSCLAWQHWKGRYIVKGNELHLKVAATGGYQIVYRIDNNTLKFIRKQKEANYESLSRSEEDFTFQQGLAK